MKRAAAAQLVKEMRPSLLAPLVVLAGNESADALADAVEDHAEEIVEHLSQEGPCSLEADSILGVLFGQAQPPADWWGTPLGSLVASQCSDVPITHTAAADILGVERGTVSTLIGRGALETVEVEVRNRTKGKGRDEYRVERKLSRRSVLDRKLRIAKGKKG